MKTCYKCKKNKDIDLFSKNKSKPDGHTNICKECDKKQFKEYYQRNKEKHKAAIKRWKQKHPEPKQKERICLLCKDNKPVEEYGGEDNLERICIACKKAHEKPKCVFKPDIRICPCCEREHKNKRENICHSCSSVYIRYKKKTYFTSLIGGKCSKCGLDDIICLDFHHVDPKTKEFTLGGQTEHRSVEEIEIEVRKCILLCAHCHRKEHSALQQKIIDYHERPRDLILKRDSYQEYKGLPARRKYDRPSREELLKMIWEKPTVELAKELGVSDKCIEKWCKCYEIPKPPRGYWSKKKSKVMSNYINYEESSDSPPFPEHQN